MRKFNLPVLAALAILPFLICGFLFSPVVTAYADSAFSWGVSPNTKGLPPTPPAGAAALLDKNNGIFYKRTDEQKAYFTFDLGYEAGYTAQVLDILKEHNIKGIFFLCGNYLKETALVERMIAEGHTIGNHTDRHKDLPALGDDAAKKDIVDFEKKFTEQYKAERTKFFRPPQGRFSERTLKLAAAENLKTTLWSIAIVDWDKKPIDAAANAEKIASRLHNGAIILFHITNSGTPEMLKLLIPKIQQKAFNIGTPDELL